MTLPNVEFSQWTPWKDRRSLTSHDCKGVYMMARFEDLPPPAVRHIDEHVIYIGESTQQCLRTRIKDFNQTAFGKKKTHGGGKAYRKTYSDDGANLYVAVFPVDLENEQLATQFILYVERKLLLEYFQSWNHLPACNKK